MSDITLIKFNHITFYLLQDNVLALYIGEVYSLSLPISQVIFWVTQRSFNIAARQTFQLSQVLEQPTVFRYVFN